MSRREVPRSELARYSQIDYDREMAFIALAAGQQHASTVEMAGEVRAACDPDNFKAEFSIHVASGWQGKGLGDVLLAKMVRYLRQRGVGEVVGECLVENGRMAALARRQRFEVEIEGNLVRMRLRLDPPR
jgi:acetyltransferase